MRVLHSKLISTVRSGSYQYAVVESLEKGLATIQLGKKGGGTRMTNLSYLGTISVGDTVLIDFSTNRPYVRAITEIPVEEEEEEAPAQEELVIPRFERMKMGANDPYEIIMGFSGAIATDPASNAAYAETVRIIQDTWEGCNMASYNLGESWQIWEPIAITDISELHDDLTEWAVNTYYPPGGFNCEIRNQGVSPHGDWSWIDIRQASGMNNGLYCSAGGHWPSPDEWGIVRSVSIVEELNMVIWFIWDAISQTGDGADVIYSINGSDIIKMNVPLPSTNDHLHFRYLNGTLFLQSWCYGLWKSSNLGETWTAVNMDLPVYRDNSMPIAISGDGNLVYHTVVAAQNISRDGAKTWGPIRQLADWEWNATMPGWWWGGQWETYRAGISFDGQHSVMLDYLGILLISNDYMQTWKPAFIENCSNQDPNITVYYLQNGGYPASCSVSDEGSVMVVGGSKPTWYQQWPSNLVYPVVYISTNYGQTFRECEVYSPDDLPRAWIPWVVVSGDGSTIYVCTWGEADYWRKPDRIFKTTDYGNTWQDVTPPGYDPSPSDDIGFASIQTSTDGSIVSALSYKNLWVSKDGGQTWETKLSDGSWFYGYVWKSMAMDRSGNMFIVADDSYNEFVKMSFDGGETWELVDVDPCVCYSNVQWISTNGDFSTITIQTGGGYTYKNTN